MTITDKEIYEQGSRTCQQYSELVTRIRTLAQQTFLAFALATGIALSRAEPPSEYTSAVLFFGGICLFVFGGALWALSHHFSVAFSVIRDRSLVQLERRAGYPRPDETSPATKDEPDGGAPGPAGPWASHQYARETYKTWRRLAWHGPFLAILLLALMAMLAGAYQSRWTRSPNERLGQAAATDAMR
ncbi:MAG TPA: hypothetical protein VNI57_05125 [Candidatus Saccharimonadales bacterium]|nr:hypothetical protein [Candidatus Saccharimonadales bacterium]